MTSAGAPQKDDEQADGPHTVLLPVDASSVPTSSAVAVPVPPPAVTVGVDGLLDRWPSSWIATVDAATAASNFPSPLQAATAAQAAFTSCAYTCDTCAVGDCAGSC